MKYVFASNVHVSKNCSTRYADSNIEITSYEYSGSYYVIKKSNWIVNEILSISEAYEKYGLIPNINKYHKMPAEIESEFKNIILKERMKKTNEFNMLDKSKLIDMLVDIEISKHNWVII